MLFRTDEVVQLLDERVGVGAVHCASLLNAFAACGGTAEAVHAHFEEELCGFNVIIENVTDQGFFCDFHFASFRGRAATFLPFYF